MNLAGPQVWQRDGGSVDAWLDALPQSPGVFLLWPDGGAPYLGRTAQLRRRLTRLLGERPGATRLLNLRAAAARAEAWLTGSWLENSLLAYKLAREHYPGEYAKVLRLPRPPYVKLILSNTFPRTQVTTRLGGGRSRYFGPFASRAIAAEFEKALLDLFQVRRCQEDLVPSPAHPGCIYGEMNLCLRPCQRAVSEEEYRSEVARLEQFLVTGGESLAAAARAARDRFSEQTLFEDAARQHARLERIEQVRGLAGDLALEVGALHGVAVTRALDPGTARLWPMRAGRWRPPLDLALGASGDGRSVSIDARLRELLAAVTPPDEASASERQDHLAILVRWFHSSSRDGEWIPIADPASPPYRRLVNAIHRVLRGTEAAGESPAPAAG